MSRFVLRALIGAAPLGLLCVATHANAQIAGTTTRPLPNVLLLVDTSGSMERMADSSLPASNRDQVTGGTISAPPYNKCAPGTASNPNRWGMLLQALTGNLQPYYSCDEVDRSTNEFKNEFKIANTNPYDTNYFLPYHRPLTGATTATACTVAPWKLPGANGSTGVGPGAAGYSTMGPDVRDMPADAFTSVFNSHLKSSYSSASGSTLVPGSNACVFEQAVDGQLDAAKDYIRFGLMTFDNDTDPGIGVSIASPQPSGLVTSNPFTGQWSYTKSSGNSLTSSTPSPLGFGLPGGCAPPSTAFEVGARHAGAPPWEGRMVPFPPPNGDLYDLETTNDSIQKVLLGTRPYGATPIDGMMEDARDYLWFNSFGPNGTGTYKDPYVNSSCRDQYIVLLTDGAPNLDLRPSCTQPGGQCPFNKAADIANALAQATGSQKVTTYVIGFSVNGSGDPSFVNDGFPAGVKDCKSWYQGAGLGTPAGMRALCVPPATPPPPGSTADACCQLNEIAYFGSKSHDVGPFFAETQADLVLSFGRILGGVSKTATTRTLPGYAPAVTIGSPSVGTTGDFIASFIPNARKVWSGEIDRTRSVCAGAVPTAQAQSVAQGDSYAANLAAQSIAGKRLFISVKAQATTAAPGPGTVIDSARTIRPYASGTPTDGIPAFIGTEVFGVDDLLKGQPNWAEALDIDASTCKRSRAVTPGSPPVTVTVPALSKTECTDMTWQFATAKYGAIKPGASTYDFNVRCTANSGNLTSGFCSISGTTGCSVAAPNACPIPGEVCVPACSALGAVYRSSPALVGTPNQFLRDDSYQLFAASKVTRRPTMYVASADGVLHAFKALATNAWDPNDYELWAFVPPAVLPKLASNYPTGQQILLDGTPIVKDVVWDRRPSDSPTSIQFHTTLVAGMGAGGQGYYALNVSDTDCGGYPTSPNGCNGKFVAAGSKAALDLAPGPHFLWQLTDFDYDGVGDPAKQGRKARDGTQMVQLFGKESGTPAITTLQLDPSDGLGLRQIGVAILPGGIDGPPAKTGSCLRALDGGAVGSTFASAQFDASDPSFKRRTSVRMWGNGCTAPVAGRGVTIVRADTGEILRHFGRRNQDVPRKILAKTIDAPFDSPMIGTPVVYPNIIGATAQKVFIGDADGAVWRIDVSSPDPAQWKAALFQDLISVDLPAPAKTAADSQPVRVPPVLSLDPSGGIVINAATGDQENLTAGTEKNYIYSIQEGRPATAGALSKATVRWYKELAASERVTGPMTVFDRTLYFATYLPSVPASGACTNGGTPTLWGMDFFNPSLLGTDQGGAPRWCQLGKVDALSGACSVALTQSENPSILYPDLVGAIIPGVTIRAAQSCAQFDSTPGDPALQGMTSTKFDIFFGATNSRTSGGTGTPQAARPEVSLTRPLPRTTAVIDAWALVVD